METDQEVYLSLHSAVRDQNLPEITRILSFPNFVIDTRDEIDQTPLILAAEFSEDDSHFEIIKLLLKKGANVNAQDRFGCTALHYLTSKKANKETIKLLLKFNANVNIGSRRYGEIPLFNAVRDGNLEIIQLLFDYGSDVNSSASLNESTPLYFASDANRLDVVKLLLKNGADIEKPGNDSMMTTMILLIINYSFFPYLNIKIDYEKMLKFYLKYAEVNAVTNEGYNVLYAGKETIGWEVIMEHLAKLQALNLPVHPKITDTISEFKDFSDYFDKCTEELTRAQNTKLHNSWVTYFNLLVDSKRKLKNYAGNKDLVEDLQMTECEQKFPIYGAFIRKNVDKAVERRKLFDESAYILSEYLMIFNPFHLIIKDILDCLTMKDFFKLCEKNSS